MFLLRLFQRGNNNVNQQIRYLREIQSMEMWNGEVVDVEANLESSVNQ